MESQAAPALDSGVSATPAPAPTGAANVSPTGTVGPTQAVSLDAGAEVPSEPRPATVPPVADGLVRVRHGGTIPGFATAIRVASPSVVQIFTDRRVDGGPADLRRRALPMDGSVSSLGSGFVIDGRGHVVTTNSVIGNARQISIRFVDGTVRPTRILGRDPVLDLAVLAIDDGGSMPGAAPLGSARSLAIGDWVIAAGNPFGGEVTASAGIVMSRQGARLGDGLRSGRVVGALLETDALIDGANAGGPLLDARGDVVGMVVAELARGDGIGRAIPIDLILDMVPQLAVSQPSSRNWLGLRVLPGPNGEGALVTEVVPKSPGARAQLRDGDLLIRVDGRAVDDVSLAWWLQSAPRDRAVDVVYERGGTQRTTSLKVEARPE